LDEEGEEDVDLTPCNHASRLVCCRALAGLLCNPSSS
jgi:hypothetical protein